MDQDPVCPKCGSKNVEVVEDLEPIDYFSELAKKTGAEVVVVKGGHLDGDATDLIYTKNEQHFLRSARIMTKCIHGTGCTFSAAITAYLTRGMETIDAIKCAKTYITQAIITAKEIGKGHAPTNHFWNAPFPLS